MPCLPAPRTFLLQTNTKMFHNRMVTAAPSSACLLSSKVSAGLQWRHSAHDTTHPPGAPTLDNPCHSFILKGGALAVMAAIVKGVTVMAGGRLPSKGRMRCLQMSLFSHDVFVSQWTFLLSSVKPETATVDMQVKCPSVSGGKYSNGRVAEKRVLLIWLGGARVKGPAWSV